MFYFYEDSQEAVNGQDRGALSGMQGFGRLDAGSRAGCTHQLKAFTTMNLGILIFLISVLCVALKNWLKRDLSALLLRTLAVYRRTQSESIEVALDME